MEVVEPAIGLAVLGPIDIPLQVGSLLLGLPFLRKGNFNIMFFFESGAL